MDERYYHEWLELYHQVQKEFAHAAAFNGGSGSEAEESPTPESIGE